MTLSRNVNVYSIVIIISLYFASIRAMDGLTYYGFDHTLIYTGYIFCFI